MNAVSIASFALFARFTPALLTSEARLLVMHGRCCCSARSPMEYNRGEQLFTFLSIPPLPWTLPARLHTITLMLTLTRMDA